MKRTLIYLGFADPAPDLYSHFFDEVVESRNLEQIRKLISPNSLILFGGGEDISPTLYNEKASKYTQSKHMLSDRDRLEANIFMLAHGRNVPMLGICRGAQLLCALNGGKVVQHVTGHHGLHLITTNEKEVIPTSSVHHQMMYPFNIEHKMLAWCTKPKSNEYVMNDNSVLKEVPCEPEVVFFPESKSLGIQGHPEYMSEETAFVKYTQKLVRKYLI